MKYVYIIKVDDPIAKDPCFKVGIASNVKKRMATIQTSMPFTVALHHAEKFQSDTEAAAIESLAHKRLSPYKGRGEWFFASPARGILAINAAMSEYKSDRERLQRDAEKRIFEAEISPAYKASLGGRVKEARIKAGLSQSGLAKLVGIRQSQISRIELDTRNPSVNVLKKIAAAVGVDISILLDVQQAAA